ncbi:hypothetical protein [Leeia oryzae]|uniref:hypothetical protein n=1 Tax=Leeia oryzae TaxID=356662 RepID=UPI00035F1613|nr:hypothetical protein [Leeia oryzae]
MTTFCIQIQPDRAPGLDLATLKQFCETLAAEQPAIERFGLIEGDDEGPFINLMFETDDEFALWKLVKKQLFKHPVFGKVLKQACMVLCSGEEGWDDYLLLHHYDETIECDALDDLDLE